MPPPYDLTEDAWEIFDRHRDLPQIMSGITDVENAHFLVGFASRCWREDGTFDTDQALRAANELCLYLRKSRQESVEGSWMPEPDAATAMKIMDRTIRGGGGEHEALLLGDPVRRALKVRA